MANRKEEYQVDHSIFALMIFMSDFQSKEVFESSLEFLNPKHLFTGPHDEDVGSDYTNFVFLEMLKTMTVEDRNYYFSIYQSTLIRALKIEEVNTSQHVWDEFFPYILNEYKSGKIDFLRD